MAKFRQERLLPDVHATVAETYGERIPKGTLKLERLSDDEINAEVGIQVHKLREKFVDRDFSDLGNTELDKVSAEYRDFFRRATYFGEILEDRAWMNENLGGAKKPSENVLAATVRSQSESIIRIERNRVSGEGAKTRNEVNRSVRRRAPYEAVDRVAAGLLFATNQEAITERMYELSTRKVAAVAQESLV